MRKRQGSVPRVLVAHPSSELYGSDRIALESIEALAAAGWSVHTTLASPGPLVAAVERAGVAVTIIPVPVLRKSLLSLSGLMRLLVTTARYTPAMMRLLREERPDIVYLSTITAPWWLTLARLRGIPVVCHLHEAEEGVPKPVRLGLIAPLLLARLVVANSERSRQVVVHDLRPLAARTQVILNGVRGPEAARPPRAELSSPLRLVQVGRISPRKGTDVAVEALAVLVQRGVDVELDLVGGVFPGYEWFEKEIRETARQAGVAERVHWHGVLPDIWSALAGADIALVPSRVEPFGNAAVEAQLAARPVIAGDTQGLREIITAGRNGELVEPGDAAALADVIDRIRLDWPAARERAMQARDEAEERFAPQRYRDDIAKIFTKALNQ